ncbi:MAG TPA: disulfide reductase [candidate division WOR-3 bacterium]|uniref:Disulfide reductase n=1 Tax=candidate division WOR-3 bacterium TaxID=2052148 RepID=A0A7V0T6Z1_UNCW3|nr:disulfide reductase [candidate division WOR-3 bacterium]
MASYAYYPGCTLYTKARELDLSARKALAVLGAELEEMPAWVCCGAIYNTADDDFAGRIGATRNIVRASALGDTLVTLCAACYNVLKRAKARIDDPANAVERERVLNFIDEPYEREVRVVHYLDVLRRDIGWDAVKAKVAKPLAGLKLASYYGCLMVRPAAVLDFDDPEDPQVMDELVRALGAEPVRFDFKTECCGGYLVVNRKDVARESSARVLENARAWGADAVITTCPLCQYNLDRLRDRDGLPVLYFTQLLGLALGLEPDELGFDNCAVDPRPMLAEKGLL